MFFLKNKILLDSINGNRRFPIGESLIPRKVTLVYVLFVFFFLIFLQVKENKAQVGQLPKIDEIMQYSDNKRWLETDCFLTYNLPRKGFRCLHANISASLEAAKMEIGRGAPLVISNPTNGSSPLAGFQKSPTGNQYIGTTFMMPAYTAHPARIVGSYYSDGSGDVAWQLEWCVSSTSPCSPVGQNAQTVVTTSIPSERVFFIFPLETETWPSNSSITINITRLYSDILDTDTQMTHVDNLRVDLTTKRPK